VTRIILIFSLLGLGCCALFAQPSTEAQPNAAKAAQKLERLSTQLELTPQQKRQLMPVLAAEAPKVEAIRNDSSLSKLQKVEQLKAIHDRTDPQVKAILTPEQYQKLQQIRRQELEEAIQRRSQQ
jgi:protein CpxP